MGFSVPQWLSRLVWPPIRCVGSVTPCFLAFAGAVLMQWLGGAFSNEFGGHPDEPAHLSTGLMVRGFLLSPASWSRPMAFAEEYYLHYPKIALGHWPPVFYLVQAAWTILVPPSRASLLILLAALAALVVASLYRIARAEWGRLVGAGLSALFLAAPLCQVLTGMLMAEVLVALLCFLAVLAYGRYADTGAWRHATTFGVLAALAIMTKGNGLALAFVPLLTVAATRRWYLLGRLSFYWPGIIVLVACGPWYWLTLDMARNGLLSLSSAFVIPYYSRETLHVLGIGLTTVAGIGLASSVFPNGAGQPPDARWAACAALIASVLLFLYVTPVFPENRHLLTLLAPLLLFVGAGVEVLARRLPLGRASLNKRRVLTMAAAVAIFGAETFYWPTQTEAGFAPVAERVLAGMPTKPTACLVSSDDIGEGMFIAAFALQEPFPVHVVFRSSKVFAVSDWNGRSLAPVLSTPEDISAYLLYQPVRFVVLDTSISSSDGAVRQHDALRQVLEARPDLWRHLGAYPRFRQGTRYDGALRIYQLVGSNDRVLQPVRLDMRNGLKRSLELDVNAGHSGRARTK
jgi:hypothetical protein